MLNDLLRRRRKMQNLKSLSGKVAINFDRRKQEKTELEHQKKLLEYRHGNCWRLGIIKRTLNGLCL
ncbi:MAG: hypothetical protein AB1469_01140 [Pseudomonadota bacterium]